MVCRKWHNGGNIYRVENFAKKVEKLGIDKKIRRLKK